MNPLQQHIEDSLEKFNKKFLRYVDISTNVEPDFRPVFWNGANEDGSYPLFDLPDGTKKVPTPAEQVFEFFKQSLLEQLDIINGEVENLQRYSIEKHGLEMTYNALGESLKRQDVLDLFKTNSTTIDETDKCYLAWDAGGEMSCTYNHTMGALCLNNRCKYCSTLECVCYQDSKN